MSAFGEKLRAIRVKHGLTVRQLSERMFTTRAAIYHCEEGCGSSAYPTLRTIIRLAAALEATEDEFRELIDTAIDDIKKEDRKLWKA